MVVVDPSPWAAAPGGLTEGAFPLRPRQAHLVAGPFYYHSAAFAISHHGLFEDHTLIEMEKFDAARAVYLIERQKDQDKDQDKE